MMLISAGSGEGWMLRGPLSDRALTLPAASPSRYAFAADASVDAANPRRRPVARAPTRSNPSPARTMAVPATTRAFAASNASFTGITVPPAHPRV
jgi:hypothetical protein